MVVTLTNTNFKAHSQLFKISDVMLRESCFDNYFEGIYAQNLEKRTKNQSKFQTSSQNRLD